ncbi:MAG: SEL1-like repeat protein [Rhizobiales bacterium]|nr:SEL1-like repeat protein [Hyphomicrobiales bacterium]MBI3673119.1 SEL1-like repeat protein [Hyphomicrobiales bacterium]
MKIKLAILFSLILITAVRGGPIEDAEVARRLGNFEAAISLLKPLAEGGDANVQYRLGTLYRVGDLHALKTMLTAFSCCKGNPTEGARWFLKAANQGLPEAQYEMGLAYQLGQGVPKDEQQSQIWYRKAIAQWTRKAVEHADTAAMVQIGLMYEIGRGVAKDEAEALKWYERAARLGNPSAEYEVGIAYLDGKIAEQDGLTALEWLTKAADQGHDLAAWRLGGMYEAGTGVPADFSRALAWYRRAAEDGDFFLLPEQLADRYYYGKGVSVDYAEAARWYIVAATKGLSNYHRLGEMYERGQGVPQDDREAARWYLQAAIEGSSRDQAQVARMYEKGQGVPQDHAEAAKWYRLSLATPFPPDASVELRLGEIYLKGDGVRQSNARAFVLFDVAVKHGRREASGKRDDLASQLTTDQQDEVRRLQAQWNTEADPTLTELVPDLFK